MAKTHKRILEGSSDDEHLEQGRSKARNREDTCERLPTRSSTRTRHVKEEAVEDEEEDEQEEEEEAEDDDEESEEGADEPRNRGRGRPKRESRGGVSENAREARYALRKRSTEEEIAGACELPTTCFKVQISEGLKGPGRPRKGDRRATVTSSYPAGRQTRSMNAPWRGGGAPSRAKHPNNDDEDEEDGDEDGDQEEEGEDAGNERSRRVLRREQRFEHVWQGPRTHQSSFRNTMLKKRRRGSSAPNRGRPYELRSQHARPVDRAGRHSEDPQPMYNLRKRSHQDTQAEESEEEGEEGEEEGEEGEEEGEEGEEEGEEGEEGDEEEEEGDDAEETQGGHHYSLRDRTRVLRQPQPIQFHTHHGRGGRKRMKIERRPLGSRRYMGAPAWSDDDVLDPGETAQAWRSVGAGWGGSPHGTGAPVPGSYGALVPPTPVVGGVGSPALAGPTGAPGRGGQMVPHWGADGGPGTNGRQPWEAPLANIATEGTKDKGAEITPVVVDPSITFDEVGGLDTYVGALKEMVFLPLVYPELFERFHITPPRGVLFHGPPGTGKTLVARALAAHASQAGRKVTFFMRKGADILSKWVGEAERQLRMLFEEATRCQPSIIFFDEIDGLAPVRSSKQDQVHNSVVSTLLALMDGLDSRGRVVVVGATNRPDALDGALRRPGRFDRELAFTLPALSARNSILDIHTRKWAQPPNAELRAELAGLTAGYCGADLRALCAEAALHAVRRVHPAIYSSEDKLLVDPHAVNVTRTDFLAAASSITPASQRSSPSPASPLGPLIAPALGQRLAKVMAAVAKSFPPARRFLEVPGLSSGKANQTLPQLASSSARAASLAPVHRPRMLLAGPEGCGQVALAAALLHALEGTSITSISLPSLLVNPGARCVEEALVHAVIEARRTAPSVLYLPHAHLWWATASPTLRACLWSLMADLPPELPLLLLVTAEVGVEELDPELLGIVGGGDQGAYVEVGPPEEDERRAMFRPLLLSAAAPAELVSPLELAEASGSGDGAALAIMPELDQDALRAKEAEEKLRAELKVRQQYEAEVGAIRSLRMALRDIVLRALCDRRWKLFAAPVSPEEDPGYWEVVTHPMDLATLCCRIDDGRVKTVAEFLRDVGYIVEGTRTYFGDAGVREVSRAASMQDEIQLMVTQHIPTELAMRVEEIITRGGPGPPPPGLVPPPEPALDPQGVAYGGDGTQGRGQRPGAANGAHTRTSARLRGEHLPQNVVHENPEAFARKMKARSVKSTPEPDCRAADAAAAVLANGVAAEEPGSHEEAAVYSKEDEGMTEPEAGQSGVEDMECAGEEPMDLHKETNGHTAAIEDGSCVVMIAESDHRDAADEQLPIMNGHCTAQDPKGDAMQVDVNSHVVPVNKKLHRHQSSDEQPLLPTTIEIQPSTSNVDPIISQHTVVEGSTADLPPQPDPMAVTAAESLLERVVSSTAGWPLQPLEALASRLSAELVEHASTVDRVSVIARMEVIINSALQAHSPIES